ncbi:MAG: HNH endonuclease [Eubacterium sp.]|nr:HNH endonuclease [Eubacterium sp.]
MKRVYTPEMQQFIADNVFGTPIKNLTDMVNKKFGTNFTVTAIKSYCSNHKLKNGRPKRACPQHLRLLTEEQAEFVSVYHKGIGPKEMSKTLNDKFGTSFTPQQIKGYYHNHHLNSGVTGYYEKGHEPMNKGRRQTEYMTAEAIERTKATRFCAGHIPQNHREVGSERVDVDGYVYVKVEDPNKWKLKHRLVWEQANGEIPEGMIVRFLDGNKLNCSLENLILITKAEHIEITRRDLHSDDPEISKVGVNIAKVNVALKNRLRKD